MRRMVTAIVLMAATCCLAGETAYELSLDFSVDGKPVASPQVVVKDGVKSTIELEGRFIDVLAKASPDSTRIAMSFWIGKLDGGERKLLATPSVVAAAGRRVELKVLPDADGRKEELMLAVTAREKAQ